MVFNVPPERVLRLWKFQNAFQMSDSEPESLLFESFVDQLTHNFGACLSKRPGTPCPVQQSEGLLRGRRDGLCVVLATYTIRSCL